MTQDMQMQASMGSGTPCPRGSFSFERSAGRMVIEKRRDMLGDVVLAVSFLASAFFVYSAINGLEIIPREHRVPFGGTSLTAFGFSVIWKLKTLLFRERLVLEGTSLTYFTATLGVMRLRHRIHTEKLTECRGGYLGDRWFARGSTPVYGIVLKTEELELEVLTDRVSESQLLWLTEALQAEITRGQEIGNLG